MAGRIVVTIGIKGGESRTFELDIAVGERTLDILRRRIIGVLVDYDAEETTGIASEAADFLDAQTEGR